MDDDNKSELIKFLSTPLEEPDMDKVRTMLGADNEPAMDAMLRQRVAQARMRTYAADRAALETRFPGAFALKHR